MPSSRKGKIPTRKQNNRFLRQKAAAVAQFKREVAGSKRALEQWEVAVANDPNFNAAKPKIPSKNKFAVEFKNWSK